MIDTQVNYVLSPNAEARAADRAHILCVVRRRAFRYKGTPPFLPRPQADPTGQYCSVARARAVTLIPAVPHRRLPAAPRARAGDCGQAGGDARFLLNCVEQQRAARSHVCAQHAGQRRGHVRRVLRRGLHQLLDGAAAAVPAAGHTYVPAFPPLPPLSPLRCRPRAHPLLARRSAHVCGPRRARLRRCLHHPSDRRGRRPGGEGGRFPRALHSGTATAAPHHPRSAAACRRAATAVRRAAASASTRRRRTRRRRSAASAALSRAGTSALAAVRAASAFRARRRSRRWQQLRTRSCRTCARKCGARRRSSRSWSRLARRTPPAFAWLLTRARRRVARPRLDDLRASTVDTTGADYSCSAFERRTRNRTTCGPEVRRYCRSVYKSTFPSVYYPYVNVG